MRTSAMQDILAVGVPVTAVEREERGGVGQRERRLDDDDAAQAAHLVEVTYSPTVIVFSGSSPFRTSSSAVPSGFTSQVPQA